MLTLPHPRLDQRAFVLHPLLELAPDVCDPAGTPLAGRLAEVADQRIERLHTRLRYRHRRAALTRRAGGPHGRRADGPRRQDGCTRRRAGCRVQERHG
jgi:hypothetical protein